MTVSDRITAMAVLCALGAVIAWSLGRPRPPAVPAAVEVPAVQASSERGPSHRADAELVELLLDEDLGNRHFAFPVVVRASSGHEVIPLDETLSSHARILRAIEEALGKSTRELSAEGSPVHRLRRINEASRFFEDALLAELDARDGIRCEIPTNDEGDHQRSGYPDLRVIDEASGAVFYLDPKLVERDSWDSSFRSFYFEPKRGTLKIRDDAVHLLVGIAHDGVAGAWSFSDWKVVDLSTLEVRLKAEFQASNRDLYR